MACPHILGCFKFMFILSIVGGTTVEDLKNLQIEFYEWQQKYVPGLATLYGDYTYNDRLPNLSKFDFFPKKVEVESFLNRLLEIPSETLPEKETIDYLIFKEVLENFIEGHKWSALNHLSLLADLFLYSYEADFKQNLLKSGKKTVAKIFNFTYSKYKTDAILRDTIKALQNKPRYGALNSINNFYYPLFGGFSRFPYKNRGDFENYIVRIQGFPKQVSDTIDNLEEAINRMRTMHIAAIDGVPAVLESLIVEKLDQSPFFYGFNDSLDNVDLIPQVVKDQLRTRAKAEIKIANSSMKKLKRYIEERYMKFLRQKPGLCAWKRGREYYQAIINYYFRGQNLTAEKIHSIGLKEINRITMEIETILRRLDFNGSYKEFLETIQGDSRFFNRTQEEILEMIKEIITERILPKMSEIFNEVSESPLLISGTNSTDFTAFYRFPLGSDPGTFVVSPKANIPSFVYLSLIMHETYPGHHNQISIFRSLGLPDYRAKVGTSRRSIVPSTLQIYDFFAEGWGLYSEILGKEFKFYKDDYELLGILGWELGRAARSVTDTGLHHFGWSKQKADDFMSENSPFPDYTVERLITEPGNVLVYKIGQLKFTELRNKAQKELGAYFNIKDFHTAVLEHGWVTPNVLERIVDIWIKNQKLRNKRYGKTHCRLSSKFLDDGKETNLSFQRVNITILPFGQQSSMNMMGQRLSPSVSLP